MLVVNPDNKRTGFCYKKYAGIAQLIEQLICNQQVGGSSPSTSSNRHKARNKQRWYNRLKEISRKELDVLVKNHILSNTHRGLVNHYGNTVGFYKTRNKRYIEDRYADMAKRMT